MFLSHDQAKFRTRMGRFKKLSARWGGRELKCSVRNVGGGCRSLMNSDVAL